ncbi:MAG: CotH kinase family protein [Nannocystis sp.]|nr:CotH kinase family protein [Nannocystis sp.]MBA3548857.1 CotH kinase family protein [Nannocystis sp.]
MDVLDPSTTGPSLPTTGGATDVGDASTSGDASTGSGPPTGGDASTGPTTGGATTTGGADTDGLWAPKPCPVIYAQELLPTFEIEFAPEQLAAITDEWLLADEKKTSEHAVKSFKYEDIVITNATARLRGNPMRWADQGKMQLEVSFNTIDKKGRFIGLKHVLFDAAAYNVSFLRDRLALATMRDVGLAAPCANNARLVLNGKYYGLFTNIEKVDSEFLERNFEEPDGNLYKKTGGPNAMGGGLGWKRRNNEEDPDKSDAHALNDAKTLPELLAVLNVEQALLEWAAEAVIPDRDGSWAGGLNLYIYNDPKTGFNIVPWDLDDTFTRLPADTDPYTFKKPADVFWGRPWYDITTADPVWFARYVDTIEYVLEHGYDVAVLQDRIDSWAAQIAVAVEEDPNKPFSTKKHLEQIQLKRTYVGERAAFLAAWLKCWRDGGAKSNEGKCEPP